MTRLIGCIALLLLFAQCAIAAPEGNDQKVIRIGIIGLDTSHVSAFTKLFNDPKASGDLAGFRVVAGFPGGSPDFPPSRDRVAQFTKNLQASGVEIVDSIPKLLEKVDVVLLESVDGRPHLAQVRPVFAAHKPVFIDKPLAGSLADAIGIAELGKKYNTPWFSSSSLRFGPIVEKTIHDPKLGKITGAVTWGPSPIEPTHPDLYWYGIHGVELLYTVMGPGCQSVTRTHTDGTDVVTGVWSGGRVGTFQGLREGKHDYGAVIFGTKQINQATGFEGYQPLVVEIAKFFKTHKPPVSAEETIEIFTFMEAADESKRQNAAPVKLESIYSKAKQEAERKVASGS